MTEPLFSDPATTSNMEYPPLLGVLLMVDVLSVEDHVPTVNTKPGERSPAVRANVTILDGPQTGQVRENALIFPKMLQGQLRPRVGKTVLGRLGQGEAKPGQSAPWVLQAATEEDRRKAQAYVSGQGGPSNGPGPAQLAQPPF